MIESIAVIATDAVAVFVGAVVLGIVHGAEPGHGWPIAATYALDRRRKWFHGFAASFLLGVGHLVSSLAVVAAFFLAKGYFDLASIDEPIHVLGVPIGGPVSVVAGVLLIALGVREYRHGHTHDHEAGHDHGHSDHHDHGHDDDHAHHHEHSSDNAHVAGDEGGDASNRGVLERVYDSLPFVGGHSHDHPDAGDLDERGLLGIVWTAFVLGFVHEEEFEIIGLCMGSEYCLELMAVYAVAVMLALIGFTMLLIAGYYRYEERVERYTEHLPTVSAVVLVVMGVGFISGVF